MYRLLIYIALVLIHLPLYSQGIRDSVFRIKQVAVNAEHIFVKEEAGMKTSRVDSFILNKKRTLSLSELLSENTSLFVKSHGRGALASASFRGTAPSHTQVNWNGININSPMTGMVDFSLIPVYVIDEINIKHGPASITDRSGGLGGSVNLSNRPDWNKGFDLKFLQGVGSYKSFDEFLQLGFGNRKIQSRTRLYYNYSANDYTFENRGIGNIDPAGGIIVHPTERNEQAGYKKYGLLQELYYRPEDKNVLSAKYWGQEAYRTLPRATTYEGPDHANLNDQLDKDHKLVVDWKHYRDNSRLILTSGYSEKRLDYSLKNRVPGLGLIPAIYSQSWQRTTLNYASYAYDISEELSLEARLDANYHDVVTADTVNKAGYDQERFEGSALLSVRESFAKRLNVNLILRQEWFGRERGPIIPYLGFDLSLLQSTELVLKGNIARNYHRPSLNDLYWQPGGNPELLPETGLSGELGLEYRQSRQDLLFSSELTVFSSDIDNWIIWIPGYKGYWEPQNIRNVTSKGIEFNMALRTKLGPLGFRASGTYAYTRSINYGDKLVWGDESYGKQLVYVPLHSGNLLVNLTYKKFFISWQHNSCSERYTTSSNDLSRRDWLYPYFMNDLSLGMDFRIAKGVLSTELKIYNLFDESYRSILYRPMPGRHYMLVLLINI